MGIRHTWGSGIKKQGDFMKLSPNNDFSPLVSLRPDSWVEWRRSRDGLVNQGLANYPYHRGSVKYWQSAGAMSVVLAVPCPA